MVFSQTTLLQRCTSLSIVIVRRAFSTQVNFTDDIKMSTGRTRIMIALHHWFVRRAPRCVVYTGGGECRVQPRGVSDACSKFGNFRSSAGHHTLSSYERKLETVRVNAE